MWEKVEVKLNLRNTQNYRTEGGGGERKSEKKEKSGNKGCITKF